MAMSKEEIIRKLRDNGAELQKFKLKRLALFGSYARGNASAGSDLDFLVEFEEKTFDHYMELKFFLEDLFSCHVDLVLPNTIKPRLRDNIMRDLLDAA
jgi:uncharacterized protein